MSRRPAPAAPDPLAAAERGLAVFALAPGGKQLLGPGWQSAATTDPEILGKTWRPGDNVGIGCWRSGVLGIDLDVNAGVDGIARFTALCDAHEAPWPDTLTVRTPSGGLHLYLAVPPGVLIGSTTGSSPGSPLGPGIDTRGPGRGGRGGYLVGPGSIVDGTPYTIARDLPIAPCPEWLAGLLALPAVPARRPSSPKERRMKIRLVGLPEEAEESVALIASVMTIVEDSGPRPRRGVGLQIQRYLDVRLPPSPPPATAPSRTRRAEPDPTGPDPVDLSAWT